MGEDKESKDYYVQFSGEDKDWREYAAKTRAVGQKRKWWSAIENAISASPSDDAFQMRKRA